MWRWVDCKWMTQLRKKRSSKKPKQRPQEPKRRPIRLPRKVLDRVVGRVSGVGRVGGVGGLLDKGMVQELVINYHSLILRLQSTTIVVSDAEGEREGSEHVLEDSDWDLVDNNETPRHRMGLRTRRVMQGGYREVVPDIED